jgi:hypothetical protein
VIRSRENYHWIGSNKSVNCKQLELPSRAVEPCSDITNGNTLVFTFDYGLGGNKFGSSESRMRVQVAQKEIRFY